MQLPCNNILKRMKNVAKIPANNGFSIHAVSGYILFSEEGEGVFSVYNKSIGATIKGVSGS